MSKEKKLHLETVAVRGGYTPDETRAITMPIHQTTAYQFNTAEQGAALFDLQESGNIYTRLTNPTWDLLGEKINLLEGGIGTLITSSGSSAITLAILNICGTGDHILASQTLYGGTFSLFQNTLKKFGITATFVDQDLPLDELQKYVQENTKLVFAETIGNPKNNILDFEKFSKLAHGAGLPLVIDNTYATPFLFRPIEHGADIVIHSATKYLGGHGNALGGAIVDAGNFDWANGNFPEFTTPDPAYHGLVYAEALGNAAYIMKARVQLIRDIGATISPFNAFLIHTGIETLHLRMERHCANAITIAKWLESHPQVEWVSYPLLPSHPDYERAKEYFTKGASGMLSFGIKGGYESGKAFINTIKLAIHAANLGDVRTIVSHPASTTHRQLSEEEQIKAFVKPNLIRISAGIENVDDLIADFEQAFQAAE
ncbi:MAG: O-acetylhomoserine aminocarboxypropyltransferase/cysteine synthase [Alphaproteobacteria bacterium]